MRPATPRTARSKEAVNWIAKNDEVAVDPDYLPGANDDCVYHSETPQGETLTVSCETEPGSGAGIPPDPGIAPPESILLLGDRHNEPGPYSYEKCASLWDDITGWINNDTPGQSERGFSAKQRQRSTWGDLVRVRPASAASDRSRSRATSTWRAGCNSPTASSCRWPVVTAAW
ncbi:MAG: hypothetical protein M5U19_04370 [Microthrixaceae bacterium]|nr:hypothetical protein [Microthrixaceae bacterium]